MLFFLGGEGDKKSQLLRFRISSLKTFAKLLLYLPGFESLFRQSVVSCMHLKAANQARSSSGYLPAPPAGSHKQLFHFKAGSRLRRCPAAGAPSHLPSALELSTLPRLHSVPPLMVCKKKKENDSQRTASDKKGEFINKICCSILKMKVSGVF